MKTITYRRAVRFDLPDHWVEEDAQGVQGTFYENGPDTGTLRVSAFDFLRHETVASESLDRFTDGEALGHGARMVFRTVQSEERGTAILLFRYEIALPIDDDLVRLLTFTYTIRADQAEDSKIIAERELIDKTVRTLRISTDRGLRLDDPRTH